MQIVIDIPEKAYTYIKREWEGFDYDSPTVHVLNGVKNSIPLQEILDKKNAKSEMEKEMKIATNDEEEAKRYESAGVKMSESSCEILSKDIVRFHENGFYNVIVKDGYIFITKED